MVTRTGCGIFSHSALGADKLRDAPASADDQSWESLAFGVIMWLCVHIFGVQDFYRSFSEHIRATMLKIFRCRSEIYLGPICSCELILVGGTMLVAADSHLGLNDASQALLDCSWWPAQACSLCAETRPATDPRNQQS